jgi:hypothetical protein
MRIKTDKQIILDAYLQNKTKKEIAKLLGCSTWKIRQVLQDAPPRYHCEVCTKPLDKHNTRFCSKQCFNRHNRKYKNCLTCNREIDTDTKQIKYCETCSTNRTRQTSKQLYDKRRNFLLEIKGGKCLQCNYSQCTTALHFHHRDSKLKKFSLSGSGLLGHTWSSILEELNKCDLLCANCHIEIEELIRRQVASVP